MKKLLGKAFPFVENVCRINDITEIRVRVGQKLLVKTLYGEIYAPFVADENYIDSVIDAATNNSRYAYEDSISNGFIDYADGIRIGVSGNGWVNNGKTVYKNFYSLCIRVPHEINFYPDFPDTIIENFENTLLISPPGGGKTTLLREIAYRLSEKYDLLIIDEREEICGKNLIMRRGKRCDVMQGVPKKYAFETAIRTMAPQIVACDELFGDDDFSAVERLILSGIKVVATYHADRYLPDRLNETFYYKIFLSSKPKPGSIVSIVCKNGDRKIINVDS